MRTGTILKRLGIFLSKHSAKILAGGAIISEVFAVIFAAKEAPIAKERLAELPSGATKWEKFKKAGPVYLPAAGMLLMSTGCIIGGATISAKQQAILAGLYSASQATLEEYRKTVIEKLGKDKAEEIQNAMTKKVIEEKPVQDNRVFSTGKGDEIFYEPLTGRYFTSTRTEVERAFNDANRRILSEMWLGVNEWFGYLGLETVSLGNDVGWNVDHMLEPAFGLAWTPDQRSCTMICYPNFPRMYK